jgi:hypothetical protein
LGSVFVLGLQHLHRQRSTSVRLGNAYRQQFASRLPPERDNLAKLCLWHLWQSQNCPP